MLHIIYFHFHFHTPKPNINIDKNDIHQAINLYQIIMKNYFFKINMFIMILSFVFFFKKKNSFKTVLQNNHSNLPVIFIKEIVKLLEGNQILFTKTRRESNRPYIMHIQLSKRVRSKFTQKKCNCHSSYITWGLVICKMMKNSDHIFPILYYPQEGLKKGVFWIVKFIEWNACSKFCHTRDTAMLKVIPIISSSQERKFNKNSIYINEWNFISTIVTITLPIYNTKHKNQ
jgi:hypothetical protein